MKTPDARCCRPAVAASAGPTDGLLLPCALQRLSIMAQNLTPVLPWAVQEQPAQEAKEGPTAQAQGLEALNLSLGAGIQVQWRIEKGGEGDEEQHEEIKVC